MPVCWIIAGPNGAGKTTFALEFLLKVGCWNFINADLIAAGISPFAPERELVAASRIFLREIEECIARGEDFAFETTLSGRGYLQLIERLSQIGWRVELIYLALPNIDMSRRRVAERVAHGGHNISTKDIMRRFPRSLQNLLEEYSSKTHLTRCFMNDSGVSELIFEQQGSNRIVVRQEYYQLLIREAKMSASSQQPSADSMKILEALRESVAKTLERKRRLGQYVVIWDGNKVVMVGDDAPKAEG